MCLKVTVEADMAINFGADVLGLWNHLYHRRRYSTFPHMEFFQISLPECCTYFWWAWLCKLLKLSCNRTIAGNIREMKQWEIDLVSLLVGNCELASVRCRNQQVGGCCWGRGCMAYFIYYQQVCVTYLELPLGSSLKVTAIILSFCNFKKNGSFGELCKIRRILQFITFDNILMQEKVA